MKDFDTWNNLKKNIDLISTTVFCNKRDVWWTSLGLNVGVEIDGKGTNFERPFLIIKKINKHSVLGIPLLSNKPKFVNAISVIAGTKESFVVFNQIKVLSTKRLLRKIGTVSEDDFKRIIQGLQEWL